MKQSPAKGEALACSKEKQKERLDVDESDKFRNAFYFDLLAFTYRLEHASETELRCLVRSFAGGKGDGIRILMALTAHCDDPETCMRIAAAAVPDRHLDHADKIPANH